MYLVGFDGWVRVDDLTLLQDRVKLSSSSQRAVVSRNLTHTDGSGRVFYFPCGWMEVWIGWMV